MLREGILEEGGEESGDGGYADEIPGGGWGAEEGGGSEDEGEESVVFGVDGEGPEGESVFDLDVGYGGGDGDGGGLGIGLRLAGCEEGEEKGEEEW